MPSFSRRPLEKSEPRDDYVLTIRGRHIKTTREAKHAYEHAVNQLNSMNAQPMVETRGVTDPLKIAQMELQQRRIPIIIRRYLPDGSHEDWSIDELIIDS